MTSPHDDMIDCDSLLSPFSCTFTSGVSIERENDWTRRTNQADALFPNSSVFLLPLESSSSSVRERFIRGLSLCFLIHLLHRLMGNVHDHTHSVRSPMYSSFTLEYPPIQ